MDEKLSIRVNIADRYYPLKINLKEEENIRKAAKLINERVLQYKQRYADKDMQDFMAMASLQFVTKMVELEQKQDALPIVEQLEELNEELEEYLREE